MNGSAPRDAHANLGANDMSQPACANQCERAITRERRDYKKIALNVYLVDDGCTDGTPEAVSRYVPTSVIVRGTGNFIWNRGMRRAWQEALKTAAPFLSLAQ